MTVQRCINMQFRLRRARVGTGWWVYGGHWVLAKRPTQRLALRALMRLAEMMSR